MTPVCTALSEWFSIENGPDLIKNVFENGWDPIKNIKENQSDPIKNIHENRQVPGLPRETVFVSRGSFML